MKADRCSIFATYVAGLLLAVCVGISCAQDAPALPSSAELENVSSATAALPPPEPLPGSTIKALTSDTAAGPGNLGRPDFEKAIWVDARGPALKSEASIKKLVADCRTAGFDTIYAQVRVVGDALYKTSLAPMQSDVQKDFDPLRTLLTEAKSGDKPLKVHAQMVMFRVWNIDSGKAPANHVVTTNEDWLTQTNDGKKECGDYDSELWLDPGVVAAQDHLALIVTDLVKNYEVDGVQLDRVRYAGNKLIPNVKNVQRTGYNPAAVERYKKEKKKTDTPAPEDPEWTAWRRDQMTEAVRKIRVAAKAIRSEVDVSAGAVTFGPAPKTMEEYKSFSDAYNYQLEDWAAWCESGIIDTNVLMDYKAFDKRPGEFDGWAAFAMENKGKARVVVGVAGWLNAPYYALGMMLLPTFSPQADGVALYGYHEPFKGAAAAPDFTMFRQVLDPEIVMPKAKDIANVLSQSLQANGTRIDKLARHVGLPISEPVAAPVGPVAAVSTPDGAAATAASSTVAATPGSMPTLTGDSATALPQLPGSGSNAEALPNLTANPASSGSAAAALPALPGSSSGSTAALPSLPSSGANTAESLTAGLPVLPGSAPSASVSPAASLPSLSSVTESAPGTGPAISGLPQLPAQSTAGTQTTVQTETSLPSLSSGLSGLPSAADLRPSATPGPMYIPPATPVAATPAIATRITETYETVPTGPMPTPVGPETVSLPDYGSMTNYTGQPIAGAPPRPTFAPPTVLTPEPIAPGTTPEIPMGRERPLAAPAFVRPDYSDRASPFGTPPVPGEIRNYAGTQIHKTPSLGLPGAGAPDLDVIVLTNGKEFAGRVLQRGPTWKIELPNGSVLAIPQGKISTVRSPDQALDISTQ